MSSQFGLISKDELLEVFSRLPYDVLNHLSYRNNHSNNSQTHIICIGKWSRSFDISYGHSRSDFVANLHGLIENGIARILISLIPDFVKSINDAETWFVMSDYWEERDDDRAIACRDVAEGLYQSTHILNYLEKRTEYEHGG